MERKCNHHADSLYRKCFSSHSESLFQPYEIGHKGQFGLGLSIVYKTVTMYGYKVEAVNRVDGGSFIIQNKD